MTTKEEFYKQIKEIRTILNNQDNLECSCPKIKCEWHGKCIECVAIHRYYKDHIPNCFQQFMNDKIKAVANLVEMEAKDKEKTPCEYWDYVKEQDEKNKSV
ncbi:MAG: hypothetical protein KAT11_06460 [Phycisphaerae bacterium]|nr:hypothetical protein [Phycisphaerae bacterium]